MVNLEDFDVVDFGFDGGYDKNDFDLSDFEKIRVNDLDIGEQFTGIVSITRFTPDEDKNYTRLGFRLINPVEMQVLDIYLNIPASYPIIDQNVRGSNNFMKNYFNFVMSTMECINPDSVIAPNGEPKNIIKAGLNLQRLIELYDVADSVTVEIIEGDDYYNGFRIVSIE